MSAGSPVAVVGMAGLFPGAPDVATFWDNIVAGRDAIGDVPPSRWDPEYYDPGHAGAERFYCRRGGFVDDLATFDPARFGIMPVAVDHADPDQFVALGVAAAALDDAGGLDGLVADPRRVGVILGRGGYYNAGIVRLDQRVRVAEQICVTLREVLPGLADDQVDAVRAAFRAQLGPEHPEAMIGLVPNLTASRIANRLDLQGPAYTVDAACASSLVAVDQAVHELRSGRCDVVLAGGSHHCHDVTFWSVFTQLGALSRSGVMRPFDRRADGLLIGEGTGVVVLERLEDALRRGHRVYAVIRGSGVASDGRDTSLMRPKMAGQRLALERAWADAGLDPATVGLLEAHGTATPAGDRTELETIAAVFGPGTDDDPRHPDRPGLGSVKSMIGHAMPAAGVAGLIKVVLALHHGVRPPTLHCDEPNRALAATRFRLLDQAEPWERGGEPRRAAVNAFGFGGTNAHVVVEELVERPAAVAAGRGWTPVPAPGSAAVGGTGPVVVVPAGQRVLALAGGSPADLLAQLGTEADDGALLARDDLDGLPEGPVRLALVGPTPKRLALARRVVAKGVPWRGRNDLWFTAEPLLGDPGAGSLAFLFPGVEPEFAPRVDGVAALLGEPAPDLGTGGMVGFQAQAIVTVGRLLDRALRSCAVVPDAVAGHSIGEMTAGLSAGLAPEADYDAVVQHIDVTRVALPDTLFAALGCGVDEAAPVVAEVPGVVISHDNCPHQCIVCGDEAAVREVLARLRGRRVMGVELPFRSGFHSPMFTPYLGPLVDVLTALPVRRRTVPVWSATLAAPYPEDEAEVRDVAVRHLVEPVRFRPMLEHMWEAGVRAFVQVGTGSLSGFVEDTLRGRDVLCVDAASAKVDGIDQLRRVLCALWVEGRPGVDPGVLAPRRPFSVPRLGAGQDGRSGADGRPGVQGRWGADGRSGADGPSPVAASAGAEQGPHHRSPGGAVRPAGDGARPLRLGTPLVRLGATAPRLAVVAGDGWAEPAAAESSDGEDRVGDPVAARLRSVLAGSGSAGTLARAAGGGVDHRAVDTRANRAGSAGWQAAGTAAAATEPVGAVASASGAVAVGVGAVRAAASRAAASGAVAVGAGASGAGGSGAGGSGAFASGTVASRAAASEAVASRAAASGAAEQTSSGAPSAAPPVGGHHGRAPDPVAVPPPSDGQLRRSWRLPVSMQSMPWLVDHAFFHMPPDWPEVGDRFPVVPMTATMQLLMDEAEAMLPGRRAVGLRSVRAMRWTAAVPPIEVEVRSTVTDTGDVRVVLDGYAKAVVAMADHHPAAPRLDQAMLTRARPTPHTAAEMYDQRWMFHGPAYHSVVELGPIGDDGLVGRIRCGQAPGSLLDGAGQLVGYWVHMTQTSNQMALPSTVADVTFFGPHPPVGAELVCLVRVVDLRDDRVVADVDIAHDDGTVWCRIRGWEERRFVTDSATFEAFRWPELRVVGIPQPGGWFLVHEGWTDAATRELLVRNFADASERAAYDRLNPKQQRQWVLGRVAAKDAVRHWLWERGAGPIYPIEVHLDNAPGGAPVLSSRVPGVAELTVSIAHTDRLGVALVGVGPVGIDIEPVAPRSERFAAMIGTAEERRLVDELVDAGADPDVLLTALWCAKEAVAKCRGTGLGGNPRSFPVQAVADGQVLVADQIAQTTVVTVEEGAYVVAWTRP